MKNKEEDDKEIEELKMKIDAEDEERKKYEKGE